MDNESCFILKRLDNGEYYQGNYHGDVANRWSPKLAKAKKFKRTCDASNALTTMMDYSGNVRRNDWLKAGNFVVQEYELQLVNERYY